MIPTKNDRPLFGYRDTYEHDCVTERTKENVARFALAVAAVLPEDARVAISPTAAQATLAVADDDTALVSIVAANDASEAGPTNGRFTLTLSALSPTDTVIALPVVEDVAGRAHADRGVDHGRARPGPDPRVHGS